MQTINLDLSVRSIIPLLHAKQGDVGRKFKAILTDGGAAYAVPAGAAVSVWYSGASGEGNYTDIGADSAVSVSGNEITVELITQMLANYGDGKLCLAINTADGDQIGTWNIPYMVEPLPGMGSAAAQQYFTAFSQAVENLPYPDTTLSVPGRAADAGAVGTALAGKAPAWYGLGDVTKMVTLTTWGDLNAAILPGWYKVTFDTWYTGEQIMRVDAMDKQIVQTFMQFDGVLKIGRRAKAVNSDWCDLVDYSASAFAPAGFGFRNTDNTEDGFMAVIEDCLSKMSNDELRHVSISFNGRHSVIIHKHMDGYASIEDISYAWVIYANTAYLKRVRSMYAGNWNEWEWDNPPMAMGVEYRTTERYNGNPVYTKVINCGNLDVGTWKTHDFTGATGGVIRYSGMTNGTAIPFQPFPVADPNNNITLGVIPGTIYISKGSTTTVNGEIFVQVWYIK